MTKADSYPIEILVAKSCFLNGPCSRPGTRPQKVSNVWATPSLPPAVRAMSHPFSNHFPPKPHRDVGGGEMVDILLLTNVVAQIPCNQHRFFDLKCFWSVWLVVLPKLYGEPVDFSCWFRSLGHFSCSFWRIRPLVNSFTRAHDMTTILAQIKIWWWRSECCCW